MVHNEVDSFVRQTVPFYMQCDKICLGKGLIGSFTKSLRR